MSEISVAELARRLCAAAHPLYSTTGASVPCGTHQNQAANLLILTTPRDNGAFRVVAEARSEAEK